MRVGVTKVPWTYSSEGIRDTATKSAHMSETAIRYEGREPVTRRVHRRQWLAGLESSSHARERELGLEEATDAVEQTDPGTRVDTVTHRQYGHPFRCLYPRIESLFDGTQLSDDGRCRRGGYVTRVMV